MLVLDLAEAKNTKKARLHSQIYDVYSIPSPTDMEMNMDGRITPFVGYRLE